MSRSLGNETKSLDVGDVTVRPVWELVKCFLIYSHVKKEIPFRQITIRESICFFYLVRRVPDNGGVLRGTSSFRVV